MTLNNKIACCFFLLVLLLSSIRAWKAKQKPTAIHFDIEPYSLSQWTTAQNDLINNFVDLIEKMSNLLNTSIESQAKPFLRVDIPVWFDTTNFTRRNGTKYNLSNYIQLIPNVKILLMDYRNTSTRIINDASTEINFATSLKKNKSVAICVETDCNIGT